MPPAVRCSTRPVVPAGRLPALWVWRDRRANRRGRIPGVGSSSGENVCPRLIDVGQPQHGDHVVEHSGAEPAPHGLVVAQQPPNGVNLLGVAPTHGLVLGPPPAWGLAPTRLWCLPCGLRPCPSAIVSLMLMSVSANIEAAANSEHLYVLLREKDPGYLAVLELAVNRVDRELDGECPEAARW
jgi:hypothetical protein